MSACLLGCVLFIALSSLACTMPQHQRDLFLRPVTQQRSRRFQMVGWGILALSLSGIILQQGASIGVSLYFVCLSFSALAVALSLSFFPQKLWSLNVIAVLLFLSLNIATWI